MLNNKYQTHILSHGQQIEAQATMAGQEKSDEKAQKDVQIDHSGKELAD